jgi:hypothetical protein
MQEAKLINTPMTTGGPFENPKLYKSIVGAL